MRHTNSSSPHSISSGAGAGAGNVPVSSHFLDLGLSMGLGGHHPHLGDHHDLAMGASMDLIGYEDGCEGSEGEEADIDYVDRLLSHSNSHLDDR